MRFSLLVGFLLFVSESLTAFSIPLFLINLDLVSDDNIPVFLQDFPRSLLLSVAFIFLCVLFRSLAVMLYQYVSEYVNHSFVAASRKKLVGIGIDQRSAVSSHTVFYLMNDVSLLAGAGLRELSNGLAYSVSASILLVLSFVYAPWESCISLALMILFIIPLKFLDKRIEKKGQETNLYSKKLVRTLTEGFNTFFLFKLYGKLNKIVSDTEYSISEYERTHKSYILVNAIKANLSLVVGSSIICASTLFSFHYLDTGGAKLVAFFYLFIRVVQQCSNVTFNFSGVLFHWPKIKELQDWLQGQQHIVGRTGESRPPSPQEAKNWQEGLAREGIVIEGRSVSFGYPQGKKLFEKIDFQISRGRPLIVKGRSGSGKSTLLMLLLGHLEPGEGAITVNGIDAVRVKDILCRYIGYVGAESYIVQGSVRSNLLYGHQGEAAFGDDELWGILRDVQMDRDIRELEGGLDHDLSEFARLSTGQKQRLAIARALLRRPQLLLLDEATANLDQVTEKNFINVLVPQLKNMAVVIVSHKPSFDSIEGVTLNFDKEP